MRLIILISVLGVTASLWHALVARAQTPTATPSTGLAISPPTFEIAGNPGDLITNSIRLENLNEEPLTLAIDRRNFTAVGEEGAVGLTEEETSFSLASWIEVNPPTTTLAGKSTKTLTFTIAIPLTAEPGGHFGSIIFRTLPSESLGGSGATLAQEIGALILVRVAGESIEEAMIDSFEPSQTLFEYGPIHFLARVKNLGNVHVKPTGKINITNLLGQQVATIDLEGKNVLPGAVRRLDATWDTKWRFGRYTATLVMVYGSDHIQRVALTNFTVIPYTFLSIVAGVIAVIAFILYRSRKRLKLAWKILRTGKA